MRKRMMLRLASESPTQVLLRPLRAHVRTKFSLSDSGTVRTVFGKCSPSKSFAVINSLV